MSSIHEKHSYKQENIKKPVKPEESNSYDGYYNPQDGAEVKKVIIVIILNLLSALIYFTYILNLKKKCIID